MNATRFPVATTGCSARGNVLQVVHFKSSGSSSGSSRTTHAPRRQHASRGCATAAAVATHVLAPTTQTSSSVVSGPLLIDQLTKQTPAPASPVVNLTPETYVQFMQESGTDLVLVDFYTDWCGPCKIMHKEMDKLTRAFPKGVRFAKFNCGLYEDFSTQIRVRSLPTFRLYKNCRCLDQVTGAKPVQLRQLLSHYWRPF